MRRLQRRAAEAAAAAAAAAAVEAEAAASETAAEAAAEVAEGCGESARAPRGVKDSLSSSPVQVPETAAGASGEVKPAQSHAEPERPTARSSISRCDDKNTAAAANRRLRQGE